MPTTARRLNVSCATASFATISWYWQRHTAVGPRGRHPRSAKRSLGRRRNGGHPEPRRFASAISRGKTIHGSLFSSHSPIPTDERGSFLWVFNFTTFLLSMDGDASTAGMLKLHRHLQKADPLFRSRYAALNLYYNFVRIRQTLKVTLAAAVTSDLRNGRCGGRAGSLGTSPYEPCGVSMKVQD